MALQGGPRNADEEVNGDTAPKILVVLELIIIQRGRRSIEALFAEDGSNWYA
jgi:hypothetical protein